MNPQTLQYTIGFGICGVLALVVTSKFTKSTDERVAQISNQYGIRNDPSLSEEQQKLQTFLNNLKKGTTDDTQDQQFRNLLSKGSNSNRTSTNIRKGKDVEE